MRPHYVRAVGDILLAGILAVNYTATQRRRIASENLVDDLQFCEAVISTVEKQSEVFLDELMCAFKEVATKVNDSVVVFYDNCGKRWRAMGIRSNS